LTVTATDKGTSKKANITITGSSTLSDEEKQQAIEEAEKQKDADLAKKAKIEAKNNAENTLFQAEKLVKDMGDKLDETQKSDIEKSKKELEEVIKKEDATREEMETKSKELQDVLMKIGEKIYSSAAQAEQNGTPNTEEAKPEDKKDNVQEAEFTEKPTEPEVK
jgi:molecular chaperone DnaK